MGMSASDAAPLPRLGEIFFDVRGSSRSMRLSWYSNTGIPVFSIWQGGTCTGTFRLPIDDLTRLVDSLRRGVPGGQADDGPGGPMAIGGQRQRLAIGAAPAEPFTGMMNALTDEQAAAYGRPKGRETGGFSTAGTDRAVARNGAEPPSLSDYAAAARGGASDTYGAATAASQASSGPQYNGNGRYDGGGQYNGDGQRYDGSGYGSEQYGAGPQYDGASQYGSGKLNGAQVNGTGQRYAQYGADAQDGQYDDAGYGDTNYGASGSADAGYGDSGYGDTGYGDAVSGSRAQQVTGRTGGYESAGQYQTPRQSGSVPTYSSGPQPAYGFQSTGFQTTGGQQSYADDQPSVPAYGTAGQAGGAGQPSQPGRGQRGFGYQSGGAPEESHGDDTGPRPVARYSDQAAYGQAAASYDANSYEPQPTSYEAQSYGAQSYEAQQQTAPSRDADSYRQAYPSQGHDQQGYQQSGYGDQGYAAPDRAERAPATPEYRAGSFADRVYTATGQQDAGSAGQYQDYGYGQQPGQHDLGPAQEPGRGPGQGSVQPPGQQGYGAQPAAAAPQPWQDTARTVQPAAETGYPAAAGAVSALSAPVSFDNGFAGQQLPGAAPAGASFTGQGQPGQGQQHSASYATPVPETDRYATSYGEQPGYSQSGGYQSQAAQQDAGRYPGAPPADARSTDGAAVGYGGQAAQSGYQPADTRVANGYGYDQSVHAASGYGDSDRGGTDPFPAGYPATSAPITGAYPDPAGANGYQANGYGSASAYGTTNGYASASGYESGDHQANGYQADYASGSTQASGHANDVTPPANGAPTFIPTFTANGSAGLPGEAGGAGRSDQPASAGYTPVPGYGAPQSGGSHANGSQPNGAQAYQAAPAYQNGNGTQNGNGAAYAANGNGYAQPTVNGNGYPSANGQAPVNGYPRDGYATGQSTGPMGTEYQPAPGYAPAGQADQAQQGYWESEQPHGNWS
jgi:hypothetical protein